MFIYECECGKIVTDPEENCCWGKLPFWYISKHVFKEWQKQAKYEKQMESEIKGKCPHSWVHLQEENFSREWQKQVVGTGMKGQSNAAVYARWWRINTPAEIKELLMKKFGQLTYDSYLSCLLEGYGDLKGDYIWKIQG